jgi:hypothetical protein
VLSVNNIDFILNRCKRIYVYVKVSFEFSKNEMMKILFLVLLNNGAPLQPNKNKSFSPPDPHPPQTSS